MFSSLFGKNKEIYEYRILEQVKVEFESEIVKRPKYSTQIAETDKYVFYSYLGNSDGSGGYILRQEKKNPKKVVFFGKGYQHCNYHMGHLFLCNTSGELGRFAINTRNVETGEFIVYKSWLGQRGIFFVVNMYGRTWCQDSIKSVTTENGVLIYHVKREKSNESENNIAPPSNDPYDIDTEYEIIVKYKNGSFYPEYIFHLDGSKENYRNEQIKQESSSQLQINEKLYHEIEWHLVHALRKVGVSRQPTLSTVSYECSIVNEMFVCFTTNPDYLKIKQSNEENYFKACSLHALGAGVNVVKMKEQSLRPAKDFKIDNTEEVAYRFAKTDAYELTLGPLGLPINSKNKKAIDQIYSIGSIGGIKLVGNELYNPVNLGTFMQAMFNAGITMAQSSEINYLAPF